MSQSKLMSFFSSATEKRKRDSDDSDESQPGPSTPKKTSRPRGFCDDWLVKYDWLYLENGKMKCHPCVNTRQNNPFSGSGCTNFRNSTLVRHQKTSAHIDALKGLKLQSDMKKSMKKAEHEQIQLQKSSLKSQRHIVHYYADVYPDLVLLASIALVIPVSSAPCERGFSQQNILKSKLRNRLNPDRLNRLLMIRLNGPDEDMDFNSAARAFGSMKDRQK